MMELLFLFGSAFAIGLSGAVMPGPVLTATISETMRIGFRAGPLLVAGHALLELALLAGAVAGLGPWLQRDPVPAVLGLVGGLLLVGLGVQMAVTARAAAAAAAVAEVHPRHVARGPLLAGILMSLANPYWILWWMGIGLNLVSVSLRQGLPGLASFYAGHISADLAWYSLVAAAVASGRRVCPPAVHRWVIVVCGIALVGLGAWFFADGARLFGAAGTGGIP